MIVSILGGTGEQGPGMALRWARAGVEVIIGSRQQARAEAIAAELNQALGQPRVKGMANPAAASAAEVVALTVPFSAHRSHGSATRMRLLCRQSYGTSFGKRSTSFPCGNKPSCGSAMCRDARAKRSVTCSRARSANAP